VYLDAELRDVRLVLPSWVVAHWSTGTTREPGTAPGIWSWHNGFGGGPDFRERIGT
jgi:hypothetical protein